MILPKLPQSRSHFADEKNILSTLIPDELVLEKEKYKDIGDDLDTAFVELILKE